MEKNIEIGLLYEFYNKLLTDKQAYIINSYYNDDLSLSEIADNIEISRQGVRKQLKDAESALYNYEDKINLVKNFLKNKEIIGENNFRPYDKIMIEKINDYDLLIKDIKNDLNKLI